jgi:hypothetical protein
MIAREACRFAEILAARSTECAAPAGLSQPGDPDALADFETPASFAQRFDHSHDLMAGDQRQPGCWQIPFDHVQIRPANGATADM